MTYSKGQGHNNSASFDLCPYIYSKSMYIIHAVQFISDMVGKISLTYVGDLANQGSVQNDMRVKSPHAPRTLEDILTVRPTLQYCGLLQERVRMPL